MSPRIKICKEADCSSVQTTTGYCRLHYLKNWKKIQQEKKEKAEKTLSRYIDSVLKRDPDHQAAKSREHDPESLDFSTPQTPYSSHDEIDDVMEKLGYKEDLDALLDNIKVDKDF